MYFSQTTFPLKINDQAQIENKKLEPILAQRKSARGFLVRN